MSLVVVEGAADCDEAVDAPHATTALIKSAMTASSERVAFDMSSAYRVGRRLANLAGRLRCTRVRRRPLYSPADALRELDGATSATPLETSIPTLSPPLQAPTFGATSDRLHGEAHEHCEQRCPSVCPPTTTGRGALRVQRLRHRLPPRPSQSANDAHEPHRAATHNRERRERCRDDQERVVERLASAIVHDVE